MTATAALDGGAGLHVRWRLRGELDRLVLPRRTVAGRRRDRLWRHTCCEAFLAGAERKPYLELNVAPSGDWALYAFDDRRSGMRDAPGAPVIAVTGDATELAIDAQLDLAPLAALLDAPPYVLGISAVIEEQDGRLAYLALHHPGPRPDFHHRGGWTLAVRPAEES
jgi:hypothetical protein